LIVILLLKILSQTGVTKNKVSQANQFVAKKADGNYDGTGSVSPSQQGKGKKKIKTFFACSFVRLPVTSSLLSGYA
jgi:hypothetical protein